VRLRGRRSCNGRGKEEEEDADLGKEMIFESHCEQRGKEGSKERRGAAVKRKRCGTKRGMKIW
jgi:hypothetical protein